MRTAAATNALEQAQEYLSRVVPWPEAGGDTPEYVNIHWKYYNEEHGREYWTGKPCTTVQQAVQCVRFQQQKASTRDIYVCMSTQSETQKRKTKDGSEFEVAKRAGANALRLKSLFADIDVKEGAYANTEDAGRAVLRFCKAIQLPLPTVFVKSGSGGLHVYWVFEGTTGLTTEEWRPLAFALSSALHHHGVHHDAGCTTDAARILRVPQTLNYKNDPPTSVLCGPWRGVYRFEDLWECLANFQTSRVHHTFQKSTSELSAGMESVSLPVTLSRVLPECAFLREAWDTEGADFSEPLWDLTTLAATFTEGGRADAHKMAQGHPGYSYEDTERKYDNKENAGVGWPLCDTIHSRGFQGCTTCPHFGKHKSPLHFQVAPPKQPLPPGVTPVPDGYTQDKDGKIWRDVPNEDGTTESVPVALNISFLNPTFSEGPPYTLHFQGHVQGSLRNYSIPMNDATKDLEKLLLSQGLSIYDNEIKHLKRFLVAWMEVLKNIKGGLISSTQFGWLLTDGVVEGFTYAGKAFSPGGERPSAIRDVNLATLYKPIGVLDKWKTAADFCLSQQRQDLAAILATAFAAPLFRFTQHPGVLVAAYSADSGIGKTTTMQLAQSVWGHPKKAMQRLDDTINSVPRKLGELQALPIYWDELQDANQMAKFTKLIFTIAEGAEKSRLDRSANMRQSGDWDSMLVSASNDSVRENVAKRDNNGTVAGVNRIFEFHVAKVPQTMTTAAADRFVRAVFQNYGKAGEVYAEWLGNNFAFIEKDVEDYRENLESYLKSETQDRLWCCAMTTMMKGAEYANNLGLTDFNLKALLRFLIATYKELRGDRADQDPNDPSNVVAILQNYLTQSARYTLHTDFVWRGPGKPRGITQLSSPLHNESVHVQVGQKDDILRFSQHHFNEWMRAARKNPHTQTATMKRLLGAKISKGRLGSGTAKAWLAPAGVIEIDLTHPALGALHSP